MSKANVIWFVIMILLFAVLGYVAWNYFRTYNYKVHAYDNFYNYDYVEFTKYKTSTNTDGTTNIKSFDTRYLAPGTIGDNYIYLADSVNGVTVTSMSTGIDKFQDISFCKGVNLRNGHIEVFNKYAFLNWQCMEFLLLPDTLKSVSDYFLWNCPYLTTIQFNSIEPPSFVLDNSFVQCVRLVRIEVPKESVNKYKKALPKFESIIFGVDKYERPTDLENTDEVYLQVDYNNHTKLSYTYKEIKLGSKYGGAGVLASEYYPTLLVVPKGYANDYISFVFNPNLKKMNARPKYLVDIKNNNEQLTVSYLGITYTFDYNNEINFIINLQNYNNGNTVTLYEYNGSSSTIIETTANLELVRNSLLQNNEKYSSMYADNATCIALNTLKDANNNEIGYQFLTYIENDCTDEYFNFELKPLSFGSQVRLDTRCEINSNNIRYASLFAPSALYGGKSKSLYFLEVREGAALDNTNYTSSNYLSFRYCDFANLSYLVLNNKNLVTCAYLENTNLENGFIFVPEEFLEIYKTDSTYGLTAYADRILSINLLEGLNELDC